MKYLYTSIIYIILTILLSSCNLLDFLRDEPDKEKNETIVPEITEENYQEAINAIETRLYDILGSNVNNASEAIKYIESIEKEDWVENVKVEDESIFIKVENGGHIILTEPTLKDEEEILSARSISTGNSITKNIKNYINHKLNPDSLNQHGWKEKIQKSSFQNDNSFVKHITCNDRFNIKSLSTTYNNKNTKSRGTTQILEGCKNRKVLIANATDGDPNVGGIIPILEDSLRVVLDNWFGIFEVDYVTGANVSVEFLHNHLTDYGLIFLIAHGIPWEEMQATCILTSSKVKASKNSDSNDFYTKWKNDEYPMVYTYGKENDLVWAIAPGFFKNLKGNFSENSIMVGIICDALDYDDNIWESSKTKGLGAFIGYRDKTRVPFAIDAFNSIIRLLINPANAKLLGQTESSELSLSQSFTEVKKNYPKVWWEVVNGKIINHNTMIELNTINENIALFSTISEEDEVNLGYPSLYASHNLGAKNPHTSGNYYELYRQGNELLDGYLSGSSYDPATKILGSEWHCPTSIDYDFLLSSYITCDFDYKGKKGTRFTGISGESILIPNCGLSINGNHVEEHLGIYQLGDVGISEEYNANKNDWYKQTQNLFFILDSHNDPESNSKGWELSYLDIEHGHSILIDEEKEEITIYTGNQINTEIKCPIRPVKKNNHEYFKDFWKTIDSQTDKNLSKVKLITLENIKSAAKFHYPNYSVKVSNSTYPN